MPCKAALQAATNSSCLMSPALCSYERTIEQPAGREYEIHQKNTGPAADGRRARRFPITRAVARYDGGQCAPASAHPVMSAPNSACVPGAGVRPAPGDQPQPTRLSSPMWCDQRRHVLAAVARRILDLLADLRRASLPSQAIDSGREVPLRMTGHARRIVVGGVMAGVAGHAGRAVAVGAAHHQRLVRPHAVGLQRALASPDGSSRSADA